MSKVRLVGSGVAGLVLGGLLGLSSRPSAPPAEADLPVFPTGELPAPEPARTAVPQVLGPDCPRPFVADLTSHKPEVVWAPDEHGEIIPRERVGDVHLLVSEDGGWEDSPPEGPFDFASYLGTRPSQIGDAVVIQGVPTLMAQMVLDEPAAQVLKVYGRQFDLNHIRPIVGMPLGQGGPMYLSFRPDSRNLQKMLNLVPQGERTLVIATVGDTTNIHKPGEDTLPAGFPAPEGAEGVQTSEIIDGATRQQNVSFVLPGRKVEQTRTEYERLLRTAGFSPAGAEWQQKQDRNTWVQSFGRGAETFSVTLLEREKQGVIVNAVWLHN